jgi:hypothetical protein
MKLQEFVTGTLKEIIAGVKESQKYAESEDAWVSPEMRPDGYGGGTRKVGWTAQDGANIEQIEFDVAVTSTEGSATEAGAGIFVAAIGLGAKGKSDTSSSSISRIKFSIPLGLPTQHKIKQ